MPGGGVHPAPGTQGPAAPGGVDEMIINLDAKGMTVRNIQHHLASTIGTDLSHETILHITDAVLEEVAAWQARPQEEFYPKGAARRYAMRQAAPLTAPFRPPSGYYQDEGEDCTRFSARITLERPTPSS